MAARIRARLSAIRAAWPSADWDAVLRLATALASDDETWAGNLSPHIHSLGALLAASRAGLVAIVFESRCPTCKRTVDYGGRHDQRERRWQNHLETLSATDRCEECGASFDFDPEQTAGVRFAVDPKLRAHEMQPAPAETFLSVAAFATSPEVWALADLPYALPIDRSSLTFAVIGGSDGTALSPNEQCMARQLALQAGAKPLDFNLPAVILHFVNSEKAAQVAETFTNQQGLSVGLATGPSLGIAPGGEVVVWRETLLATVRAQAAATAAHD